MRQAGALPNEADAHRFVDYLLTLGIEAKVDASGDGWAIWIYDESRLAEGKAEVAAFQANPQDAKYADVQKKAESLRREAEAKNRQATKNIVDIRHRWASPGMRGGRPLTFILIVACIVEFLIMRFGDHRAPIRPYLAMTAVRSQTPIGEQPEELPEIKRGEVWRLVTPIFIHKTMLHLLFNMYMLFVLGGMIEDRYGTAWFGGLALLTAISSNLTEYFWQGPYFGGISGVNFALFGYIWMKSKFDPGAGLYLGERDVFLILLWFVVCFTGWVGDIANGAHAGGLVTGMISGYLPKLIHRS